MSTWLMQLFVCISLGIAQCKSSNSGALVEALGDHLEQTIFEHPEYISVLDDWSLNVNYKEIGQRLVA